MCADNVKLLFIYWGVYRVCAYLCKSLCLCLSVCSPVPFHPYLFYFDAEAAQGNSRPPQAIMGRGAEDPERNKREHDSDWKWIYQLPPERGVFLFNFFFSFQKQSSVWARGRTDLWDQKMIQACERNCATAFEPAAGILTLVMIKAARAHFRRSESSERKNSNRGSPVQFDPRGVILHLRRRGEAKKWARVFGLLWRVMTEI